MLWPREEFHAAYGQIKHDALQSGGCSVLILVALDVDALCASEILTRLLQSDFVSYSLLAVRGYEDILRVRENRIRDETGRERESELRSVIMVNCGAIVNVAQLLALPLHIKCYVFDSHRPIHLANIYDEHQQIVVFDDGAQSLEDYPAYGSDIDRDEYEGEEEEEEDDEDDGDEDEDDDDGEEEFDPNKDENGDEVEEEVEFSSTEAPVESHAEGGDSTEDTEDTVGSDKRKRDEDNDVDMDNTPKKRRGEDEDAGDEGAIVPMATDGPVTDKEAKRRRREEILRYYRGSFYGAPAATIAFELAQQMNSSHRELLWYAIIGLTKQFVLEEIDVDNYNLMVHHFQDEVLAIDESPSFDASQSASTAVVNPATDHGKIGFEEEYRFMCYRHWSLYEAMYYSDYVASKLGLYLDRARRIGTRNAATSSSASGESDTALHVFLARMGLSLRQTQQKFTYMPLETKQMLRAKIQEVAPEFELTDVFYGSFKRQFAFQYQLCAADAVYGLQALLEAPESYISTVFQAEQQSRGSSSGAGSGTLANLVSITAAGVSHLGEKGGAAGEGAADGDEDSVQDDFRQQNFMLAHTALSCRSVESSKLMESGIKVAMELKRAIVRVGISIMERKLIVRVKHFRYVSLHIPEREQELFASANVLTQLALFLLNVHRASGKWGGTVAKSAAKAGGDNEGEDSEQQDEVVVHKTIVPLVLITRNPAQNCFLVVGITCPSTPGEVHRNTLGTAFKLAAGETGANFRQDGFTSAVMEIQMDDIQFFVEQLHNVLDA